MMKIHEGSRRSLFLISLFFVVLGSLMLTGIVLKKPWIKRPQIVSQRMRLPVPSIERNGGPLIPMTVETKRMEEKPLEAGTEEYRKSSAGETGYRDAVFRREIIEEDIQVMDKKPTAIPAKQKRATSEIHEKSEKQIPQSPSITRGLVELEKEREAAEPGTPERQEKHVGSRALSSVKPSFPVVESETAMSDKKSVSHPAQLSDSDVADDTGSLKKYGVASDLKGKGVSAPSPAMSSSSSIEGEDRVIRPKLPPSIATEEEVRQFFADYIDLYNQKDIAGFLSLFSPKAVQNQREGFNEIRSIYSDFFNKSEKLRYHLEDMKIKISQNTAEATGQYKLVQKQKRRWKKKVWKGDIHWVLVRENGALKIRYLDYTPEKSP